MSATELISYVKNKDNLTQFKSGEYFKIPTDKFSLPFHGGEIKWEYNSSYLLRNNLLIMDLLASNNWNRPIYFAVTVGRNSLMGLEKYFRLDGLAYKLTPYPAYPESGQIGSVCTDSLYNTCMNIFTWKGINDPRVFLDENNNRMLENVRNTYGRLALELVKEDKKEKALVVADYCMELLPNEKSELSYFTLPFAKVYYSTNEIEKGNYIIETLLSISCEDLENSKNMIEGNIDVDKKEIQRSLAMLQEIARTAREYDQEDLAKRIDDNFDVYSNLIEF